MSAEWVETALGQIVTFQRGFDLPTQSRCPGPVPIMGSAGISGYHNQATTKGPGVVVGRSGVGSMGVVSYIAQDYWALNTTLFVKDFRGNDEQYVFYLLSTINFRQFDTGSAQASLNRNVVYPHRVTIPSSVEEQKAIAGVLRAFDDRVALLRETNATFEAIAQALFKSWFVDFDPVHAKQQGIAPAEMDEATAALFPDSFAESELGLVPRSWTVGKVETLMELAYGKALKATERVAGDVPVYGSGGITGYHNRPLIDGASVVVGRKGTVGSLYWEDRPLFPIDTVFYVKAKVPLTYCFYQLGVLGLGEMNTDGAVPGLNRNNVYRLPVVLPSPAVVAAFDSLVRSLRDRIFANDMQAQSLSTLRDTLLPRLISGQLRLPEAEAHLTEAAA